MNETTNQVKDEEVTTPSIEPIKEIFKVKDFDEIFARANMNSIEASMLAGELMKATAGEDMKTIHNLVVDTTDKINKSKVEVTSLERKISVLNERCALLATVLTNFNTISERSKLVDVDKAEMSVPNTENEDLMVVLDGVQYARGGKVYEGFPIFLDDHAFDLSLRELQQRFSVKECETLIRKAVEKLNSVLTEESNISDDELAVMLEKNSRNPA